MAEVEPAAAPQPAASGKQLSLDDKWLDYGELQAAKAQLSVDDLLRRLHDGRSMVRANALLGLAAVGHTGGDLIPFLRDADLTVAIAAATALAHLGVAQRGNLTAVATALESTRREVSEVVLRFFSQLVGKADAELIDVLDTGSEIRANAIVAACALVANRGLHLLHKAARDERVRVRINAVNGVAQLGSLEQVASMEVLTEVESTDAVSDVRAAVRAAIGKLRARTRAEVVARRKTSATVPPAVPELERRVLTPAELRAAVPIAPIDELLRALEAPHVHARINAARVLALKPTPATARALAVRLRDPDETVRAEVAIALGKLGAAGIAAAPALVAALDDSEPAVVAAAEGALADQGEAATAALVNGLDSRSEPQGARIAALLARLPEGATLLRDALASTSVDVRVHAAHGLAALGKPAGTAATIAALGRSATGVNARLRSAVAKALAILDPKAENAAPKLAIDGFEERLLDDAALAKGKAALAAAGPAGLALHLHDARVAVRANAALAIGTLGTDALPVAPTIAVCLRDDAPEVRLAAARTLDRLGDVPVAAAAPDLVRALRGADDALAAQIATTLGSRGQNAVDGALLDGLATDDPRHGERIAAIICMRPTAVDLLWTAFQNPQSRVNAARGFVLLGKDRLGRARELLRTVGSESPVATRDLARATLREIDGAPQQPELPAVPSFETQLLDGSAFTDPSKLDAGRLFTFLQDGRPIVRANAATALGTLGPAAAAYAAALGAVLRDDDERVRLAAARAIDKLGDDGVVAAAGYLVGGLRGSPLPALAEICRATLAARKAKVERALLAGLETSDEAQGMRTAELIAALPNARELLFIAFDGPAQNVQMNAAHGIGVLGQKAAGPAGRQRLVAGLTGPFTPRREAMVKALALLERTK